MLSSFQIPDAIVKPECVPVIRCQSAATSLFQVVAQQLKATCWWWQDPPVCHQGQLGQVCIHEVSAAATSFESWCEVMWSEVKISSRCVSQQTAIISGNNVTDCFSGFQLGIMKQSGKTVTYAGCIWNPSCPYHRHILVKLNLWVIFLALQLYHHTVALKRSLHHLRKWSERAENG